MAPRAPKSPNEKPAKAAKPAKPAAKQKAAPAVATPDHRAVAAAVTPDPIGGVIKLRELVDSVATATGGKKPDVKKMVEATLAALGEALASGKPLMVPPLGKLRVVKNKGPALTLKLRLADGAKAAGLALADDGEDD
jgi:hypothetical protein